MYVRMWMTENPVVVESGVSLPDAHALLLEKGIRRLPVVDNGRLVGIVTLTDLQKLLFAERDGSAPPDPGQYTVRDVMSANPLTVGPSDPIEHAALLMWRNRISSLPVVADRRVMGIITETDVFRAFIGIMGLNEQEGRRIVLEVEHENSGLQGVLDFVELHEVTILSVVTLHSWSRTHALVVIRVKGFGVEPFTEDIRNSGRRVVEIG